jgi:hypothetical protein
MISSIEALFRYLLQCRHHHHQLLLLAPRRSHLDASECTRLASACTSSEFGSGSRYIRQDAVHIPETFGFLSSVTSNKYSSIVIANAGSADVKTTSGACFLSPPSWWLLYIYIHISITSIEWYKARTLPSAALALLYWSSCHIVILSIEVSADGEFCCQEARSFE